MTQKAKHHPVTEQRNEKSQHLDRLNVQEIVTLINEEDQTVALKVKDALPQITAAIEAVVEVMTRGGRLFYIGAGTSGRLGILDASECPPTFGVSPELVNGIIAGGEVAIRSAVENAEDDSEEGARTLAAMVQPGDVVVGIAASGTTPYVIGAMREANRLGIPTVGISCNQNAPLSAEVKYPIEVAVGPEIVTGSTRLKAGTAQKMVLNMISTTAMIRLGKVYGNLMVNMQATNQKLRERMVRIIRDATGADEESARRAGMEAGGDARIAILMIMFGIGSAPAEAALTQARGHFGEAVNLLSQSK
ncbi:N-acetylmuramic acid 6-phosphate etherase [Paenibacillus cremeus]|uniref:N-acetylmuramic acid 6-phosphate etherase n=1 Tax=Paenibacillus cremeus TaxID=2163881 RepID=A0A559KDH0_9BACL|nr:N-acetylmuramic acid 6-phosphate etherase [Paenibacillus cremeus]TVY10180.1 N-acetylmuramic acid 6-phosphate etherase [Paenibacillus cremeus]